MELPSPLGSSDPSAHDAMSSTDPTASSCSIVRGFAAKTEMIASDPANRCAPSAPGAGDSGEGMGTTVGGGERGTSSLPVGKGHVGEGVVREQSSYSLGRVFVVQLL